MEDFLKNLTAIKLILPLPSRCQKLKLARMTDSDDS